MADGTKIEWTDATVNAVNGCSVVSPGCKHCYAMKQAHRFDVRRGLTAKTAGGMVWTGETRLNEKALLQPLAWKRPRKIFWNAHGDLFHPAVPDEVIDRCFAVMALTPHHTHQVLTKRSARMRSYMTDFVQGKRSVIDAGRGMAAPGRLAGILSAARARSPACTPTWALPNVWLGVSVEDQQRADERIPDLLATPAAVRFLSCEPLLGPVDLSALPWHVAGYRMEGALPTPGEPDDFRFWHHEAQGIRWVIVGGESGHDARPMHPDWARSLRDQCAIAGVPFLFKQHGEWREWDDGSGNPEPEEVENDTEYADAVYASAIKPAFVSLDGRVFRRDQLPEELPCRLVERVGKKAAGRLLDGVQHDGMPA